MGVMTLPLGGSQISNKTFQEPNEVLGATGSPGGVKSAPEVQGCPIRGPGDAIFCF